MLLEHVCGLLVRKTGRLLGAILTLLGSAGRFFRLLRRMAGSQNPLLRRLRARKRSLRSFTSPDRTLPCLLRCLYRNRAVSFDAKSSLRKRS
jgi:hypothetical protein